MKDITPKELKQRLDSGDRPFLLDVRQPEEVAICAIEGAHHIPMGDIPSRLQELDRHATDEIIIYCHHGMRSANVQQYLRQMGFEKVRNLIGGIDAYAVDADVAIQRY